SYQLRIKQDQRFNTLEYSDVPYMVSAFSADFQRYDTTVLLSGRDQYYTLYCPFEPVYWALDFDEKISDAISDEWLIAKDTGTVVLETAMMQVGISEVKDSVLLRVEHHWLSPDQYYMNIPGLFMSRQRYWNVDGVWKEEFKASAVLEYNGQMPFS